MIVTPAPYLPFMDPVQSRMPGLQPLDPERWTEPDAAFAAQMAYRDRLVAERPDRVALARPTAEPALRELARMLGDHLERRHGYLRKGDGVLRPDGVTLPEAPDIATLARFCQEDWLILEPPAEEGEYILAAGAVCFPTGWDLRTKIGQSLTHIHAPVPGYAGALARRVNRIFEAIRPDTPLWRVNFSVAGTPELHCPGPHRHHTVSNRRYLRTERQTLRRLPESGAVVFGVKVHVTPVETLTPDQYAAFRDALAAFSPDMAAYKAGADYLTRQG